MNRYLYIDKYNILKSISSKIYHYEFVDSVGGISVNVNNKLATINCRDKSYSDISSIMDRNNNSSINILGKYELRPRILINGIYYYIRYTSEFTDKLLFTCIISKDYFTPEYHIEDNGEYIIVPENCRVSEYIDVVNSNSKSIYLEMSEEYHEFQVANIFGIDLYDCKSEYTFADVTPYDKLNRIFLDEPTQIAELIRSLRDSYPTIQFYTDPNDRNNFTKTNEFLYYEASVYDDDNRTTGILQYNDPIYGKVLAAEIPIRFRYETPDIIEYLNRRNEYLLNKFINTTIEIYPKVKSGDPIHIGISWNRELNEQKPEKIRDESDRVVYSFEVRCVIHALLLEKIEEPNKIDDVIVFIYGKNNKLIDLNNITTEIVGTEVIEYDSPPRVK